MPGALFRSQGSQKRHYQRHQCKRRPRVDGRVGGDGGGLVLQHFGDRGPLCHEKKFWSSGLQIWRTVTASPLLNQHVISRVI